MRLARRVIGIPMRRDPELKRHVLRGYVNLAVIVLGATLLVAPIALDHSSIRGVQASLIAEAILAIGLALVQRFVTREWTVLFSSIVILGGVVLLMVARFFTNTAIKDIGILLALGIMFYALPKVAEHERTHSR